MDLHPWKFVRFLQDDDQGLEPLLDTIRAEPALRLHSDPDVGEFQVGDQAGVSIAAGSDSETKRFLRWWLRRVTSPTRKGRDALTGLLSRTHWERTLKETEPLPESVALLDLDHFKQFNDNHGHDMGDRVLQATGREMLSYFSDDVHVIRYGGEEFLILLKEEADRARQRLDQFRRLLAVNKLFDEQPRQVSVSVGIAGVEGEPVEKAITRADVALYESKRRGRNRVTVYGPHLEEELDHYVWGRFRHLKLPGVRLSYGDGELILGTGDGLLRYDWTGDVHETVRLEPGELNGLREVRHGQQVLVLLDEAGQSYGVSDGDLWTIGEPGSEPPMIRLLGHQPVHGVGANNQVYRREGRHWKRHMGLPSDWDRICRYNGAYYLESDRELIRWENEERERSWSVPFRVQQMQGGGRGIYLLSDRGELYRFRPDEDRFQPVRFRNLSEPPVLRSVAVDPHGSGGDGLAVRDDRARLYISRSTPKSVAQSMNLPDLDRLFTT